MNDLQYYFLRYFLPHCKNIWKPSSDQYEGSTSYESVSLLKKVSMHKQKPKISGRGSVWGFFFPVQLYKNDTVAKLLSKNPLSSYSCITGQAFWDGEIEGQGTTSLTTSKIKKMNQTTTKSMTSIRNGDMDMCLAALTQDGRAVSLQILKCFRKTPLFIACIFRCWICWFWNCCGLYQRV